MSYSIEKISYATVPELYRMYDAGIDGVGLKQLKHFQLPFVMSELLASLNVSEGKKI